MKPSQTGYALIVVLLLVALVLISLSAATPRVLTQGQREKELELIFRGEQYKRAIGHYYKKFGRYPMKIEDLLETNDRAFLRREYRDPMTRDGSWRLIRVGPSGELMGSVHDRAPLGQPAGAPSSGEETDSRAPTSRAPSPSGTPDSSGEQASSSGSGSASGGGNYPIAGVASTSTARAIRIYEGYNQYNQWEFIYDPVEEAARNRPAVPGSAQPSASGQPSEPESK